MADTGGLGYKDHSPYGALGINLAFGKRPDGAVLHISEVVSGLKCDCVCPACDVRLVAHKSNTAVTKKGAKRHHFKHHHDGAACNYGPETNAHYFAKRLLEQVKWITLPERIATVDGVTRVMREKERHEFDEVIVEPRLGKIIPDLILIAKGHRLLVEVYVTHRCDDDKIAHIRTVGLSAVEVDLSAYRTSHDDEAIAAAILTDAPRAWLHNRLADSDRTKLRIENTKRQRAKEAQAEQHARRILDAIRSWTASGWKAKCIR